MSVLRRVKLRTPDGTESIEYPLGVQAENVEVANRENLSQRLARIDEDLEKNEEDIAAVSELAGTNKQNIGANEIRIDALERRSASVDKKPYYFNTVADMKAYQGLIEGDMAITLGYYEANDGGGAEYKIVSVLDNDEFQIEIGNKYATLIIKNKINIKQIGCKDNDNTFNNSILLSKAFNYKNISVYIPKGFYYCSEQISALKSKKIYGNGTLIFTNATNDGLIIGDSIQLDGLEINCSGNFTGTVLIYNGEIGERTYPSIATFTNLVISSNTSNQIECLFDFNPWRNYGVLIENIKIGKQGDVRKADYGFKMDTNTWANNMSINEMVIDIMGNNIMPFYLNNTANTQNSYWSIQGLIIQIRSASYNNFAYINGFSNLTISNSHFYDTSVATSVVQDMVYNKCAYINVIGSADFRLINAIITNPISTTTSHEGYSTETSNGSSFNSLNEFVSLSSYADKIVPILFPSVDTLSNRCEIEISTRYSGTCFGNILKMITTACSTSPTTFYNRNILLLANKYHTNPIIYKIETVYEGTIVWVRGGFNIYYWATCWKTPKIAIGETVHVIGDGTAKTLSTITFDESTQWLPITTYPLYYWGVKEIDSTTFSQGE